MLTYVEILQLVGFGNWLLFLKLSASYGSISTKAYLSDLCSPREGLIPPPPALFALRDLKLWPICFRIVLMLKFSGIPSHPYFERMFSMAQTLRTGFD